MSDLPSAEIPQFPRLGSYKILRPLGSGGMSNVFQAIHEDTGSVVALKVLPRKLAQNPVLLQRFLKEAKSAEALDHPNIVAIYDRGNDGGRHYLVLEFVDGRDLFDYVRSLGPLDNERAIRLAHEVAEGLRYASQRGMIHRDIKPANLLMTTQGVAKIIDLGLALQTIEEDERVTRQGTTVGTVDYMSPEQARDSRRINEASDIYSLGCTLFYLVTGTPPYAGGTLADKLARHHSAEVPDPRDRNPAVSVELAGLIRQMMAKQPADRPESYDDLLGQLDRIARGEPRLPQSAPLDVLIDDEDDSEDAIELTVAEPNYPEPVRLPSAIRPAASSPSSGPPEFSLADLAALDANPPAEGPPRRRKPPREAIPTAVQAALLEPDEEESEPMAVRRGGPELPLRTWIMAGLFVGLAIALVGVGLSFLVSALRSEDPADSKPAVVSHEPRPEPDPEPSPAVNSIGGTPGTRPPDRSPPALPVADSPTKASGGARSQPEKAQPVAAHAFGPEDLARFGFPPDGVAEPTGEASPIVIRRLDEPGEQVTDSLASALERPAPVVEIADAGPVREDHFEMTGKTKVIRGRGGYHPILRIDSGSGAAGRVEVAKLMLGGSGTEHLVLKDLDLVVDLRDLPPNQTTLFQCQGVDLDFIHCSITIHNGADRVGFSLIRTVNGLRPNRIRLDRCLVRGPIPTLIDLQADQTELDVRRSVVVGAGSPLVAVGPSPRPTRTIRTLDSVLITSGPLLDATSRPERLTWRSLGTAFLRSDPATPAAWLGPRGTGRENLTWLDFDGQSNRWDGWVAPPRSPRAADGADHREDRPWPLSFLNERITAIDFRGALADGQLDLPSVATPHPSLYEQTVDRFPRLANPDGAGEGNRPSPIDPRPLVSLTFDIRTAPEDLGTFLTREVTDGTKRYEVRLAGAGVHSMNPVRLPDGIDLTLLGPTANGSMAGVLQLTPARSAPAILALGRSVLGLENLGFLIDETKLGVAALAIDGGAVSARMCSFRSRGEDTAIQPALIQGRAGAAVDRPFLFLENCWIWTTRPAIALDLPRGSAQLKNCVVLAGRSAIQLRAAEESSSPLDINADLSLENCTVLAERTDIDAAELGSTAVRPDRPFLIWSRACVFPRSWRDQGTLLAVDRERFALGNLFWDSANDLYDVSRLLADAKAEGGSVPLADLRRHWVEVWGGNHARLDRGPDPRRADRILNFRDTQRSRTTRPTLSQLELEKDKHRGQGANFAQLPPIPRS